MTELFCSSTRYYITIISGGAIRGSVVVSFCFARCPSAITQKLDFTGLVTGGGVKINHKFGIFELDFPIPYTTSMSTMTIKGTLACL